MTPPTDRVSPYAGAPDRPVFIGACPRSGTTLLRTMLNNHPALAIPRETRHLPYVWDIRSRFADLGDNETKEALATQIARRKWTRADRFGLPRKKLWQRLVDAPPTLGSVLGTGYLVYAEQTGKPRWGDKRPMYARYLDAIYALFPDAQFINVVRDPRGSAASIRKVGWYDGQVGPGVELWERSVASVDPWRSRLAPDQLIDVRYEDLVADPKAELTRITTFLGIDADVDTMLTFYEEVDETSEKFHSKLAEPVSTASVDAWQQSLDDTEVALVESIVGPLMDRFGYERRARGIAVPVELHRSYDAQRAKRDRERLPLLREERRLRFRRRRPVAARLTTGQLAGHKPMRPPKLRARVMGRPQ
jgi:hypothetical protein